jgi:hypothetical protein
MLKHVVGYRPACNYLIILVMAVLVYSPASAAPIAVRFPEGVTHGFLLVRSLGGEILGQGEVTQIAQEGGLVEGRLVFRFNDGSVHDEKVAFSQNGVFTLLTYHLIQRGPFFPEQVDIFFDRGAGEYKVKTISGENEQEEIRVGKLNLPKDAYNGMVVMTVLNLLKDTSETVKILIFTPEPEVINLELLPEGEHTVRIGNHSRKAMKYVFKPDIGLIRKWLGRMTGRLPDHFHYHCWVLADEIPSFVAYEGPLQLMGPLMKIELVSPDLLAASAN